MEKIFVIAKRGWDCLPDWELAADLWVARITCPRG